jgi:DNA ligase (NAD+)
MDFKENPGTDFQDIKNISKQKAKEEINALREGIEYHDCLYYVKNEPEISDAVYDRLFSRLQELEKAFPEYQSSDSPTRRVGSKAASKLDKISHRSPMLSLNAVSETDDIENFLDFVTKNSTERTIHYALEPKFDGLSVEIVYENGEFQYGATRGDGDTGEDISRNIKTIHSIPMHLQDEERIPPFLSVRAEVFILKKGFRALNKNRIEEGEEPFVNPRNAAAGLLRQLDPGKVAGCSLDVRFYEILDIKDNNVSSH